MYHFFKILILFTFVLNAFGQTNEFLPLSRYGIGIINKTYSPLSQACGHAGIAFISNEEYNILNPASLGFLRITDAEFGFSLKSKNISDGKTNVNDLSGALSYLQIGVPLRNSINEILEHKEYKNNYALSLGLSPLSSTSYSYIISDSGSLGKNTRNLNGSGGLNQFQIGFSYRVKNFSAGVNLGYVFGNFKFEQDYYILERLPLNRLILTDQYFGSGLNTQVGLLYEQILDKSKDQKVQQRKLSYGLTIGIPSDIRYFRNSFHRSELLLNPLDFVIDTQLYVKDEKSFGQLPLKIIGGISYNHKNKYGILLDAALDNWSSSKVFNGQKGTLVNESSISAGAWWKPDNSGYGNIFKRSQYRFGAFYNQGYLELNDNSLSQYGVTFGLGTAFNFQRQLCVVNLSVELGKTELPTAIKEEYIKLNLGIRINDNEWFLKRRYN